MHNWYKVLGTTSDADNSQLKSSFRHLAKTFHPDLNAGDKRAEERLKEVNQAYEVLRDPGTRAVYDAVLADKRRGDRQRFWKAAATMSATFAVCVGVSFPLVIWFTGAGAPLAQDRETARSDGEPAAPFPRIATSTVGAADQVIASPPIRGVEERAPQVSSVRVRAGSAGTVHGRWITYQRRRASHIAKVALSASHTTNVPLEADGPPSRPSPAKAELAQGERMLNKGEQSLTQGNIVTARHYFARAAALGLAIAALKLAETHDPHELVRFKVYGLKHDPAEAKRWYERALELGANEAEPRLRRLANR